MIVPQKLCQKSEEVIGLPLTDQASPDPVHQFCILPRSMLSEEEINNNLLMEVINNPQIFKVVSYRGSKPTYPGSNTKMKKAKTSFKLTLNQ